MLTANTQNAAEALGQVAGLVIAACLFLLLRAWLLSLCVALLAPSITLSFWQWLLIAFTARLFLTGSVKRD